MISKIYHLLILSAISFVVIGCGPDNEETPEPASATLTFPESNSACITGNVLSGTESSVTFKWNAAANAEMYELHVKNLLTGQESTETADANQLDKTLLRNTPYSWYVVSKSTKSQSTAKSNVWKFYNSGAATVSHPPFPADITYPSFAQEVTASNGMINLTWSGNDVDKDIVNYDIYLGTTTTPSLFKSGVIEMSLSNVPVIVGTTYYWRVVSKDASGNTSQSALYQFRVN